MNLCGEGVRDHVTQPSQAEVENRFSKAKKSRMNRDTWVRIMSPVRDAEPSLAAAGRREVTWFWEKRKQSCKDVRERWAVSVRRYLCFWILRDIYDQGGQTQDSQSVRPGFKSLPCNLLVPKFGVSHLTCPSLFPWTGSSIPSTPRITFAERTQGDAICRNDFKAIHWFTCQVLLPLFFFLLGHWEVEHWKLLTHHEGGRAGNGDSYFWREGRVSMGTI